MTQRPEPSRQEEQRQSQAILFSPQLLKYAYSVAPFLFAAVLLAFYITPLDPIGYSGDAATIWTGIVGLAKGEPVLCYVMYKGVFSCYPYVWFYQLSQLLGLPDFFFIKLYHIFLFAYTAAIGFPNIYRRLTGKKSPSLFRKLVFILVLFLLTRCYRAYDQLMVDLPSLACFIACVSMLLNWHEEKESYGKFKLIVLFFLLGCCQCFSGQYLIAAWLLLAYGAAVFYTLFKSNRSYFFDRKLLWLACLAVFLLPRAANSLFFRLVVTPFIEQGTYFTTGWGWLKVGLNSGTKDYAMFSPPLATPKGALIADEIAVRPELILLVWLKHPLDMIQIWCNRLFLAFSTDGLANNLLYLTTTYTAVFVTFWTLKKQYKTIWRQRRLSILIYFSFLFAVLVPCALHMEGRYALQVQGLVLSFLFFDDSVSESVSAFFRALRRWKKEGVRPQFSFPTGMVCGVIFVLCCMIHFGTLMELQALDGGEVSLFSISLW